MKFPLILPVSALSLAFAALSAHGSPLAISPDQKTGTSLAVIAPKGALAHTAQFLPLDPTGRLVGKDDAPKQIEQTLANLSKALRAADSSLKRVVKLNVYVAKPEIVEPVEKEFSQRFKSTLPAVSFVVGALSHPDALVAMDAVATSANRAPTAARIHVAALGGDAAFAHVSVLPEGSVVYVSGQAKPGSLAEATTKTLESLEATLKFLALSKSDIVQLKAFVYSAADAEIARKRFAEFFAGETVPPLVFVDWISPNLPIEIELIAAVPENRTANESVTYLTPPDEKPSPVYSRVARVNYGRLVYVSGLYGKTAGDSEKEILEIFESLKQITGEAGCDFNSLAKATYYVSNASASTKLNELRPRYYDPKRPPAASKAMVNAVGRAGMSITLDIIAATDK